jgi:hypothetical protein
MDLEQWRIRWNIPLAAMDEFYRLFIPTTKVDDTYTEGGTNKILRLTAPQQGCILWRNNSGAAVDKRGQLVRYGLGNDSARINGVLKSSDLIGITPVQWQGKVFGVFTAVESKRADWRWSGNDHERAQANYLALVQRFGGIATFATNVNDYLIGIGRK